MATINNSWKKYLLWFAQEHVTFRFQEIESLQSLFKIEMRFVNKPTQIQPYWIVEFAKEDDVRLLAHRSVSIRSCIELWGYADNLETLHQQLKSYPKELMEQYLKPDLSFKVEVETFCKHFTQKEKVDKIEMFNYLPVQGEVCLKNPDVCLQYIEYYGVDPKNPPETPYAVFFGRLVASGLRQKIKKLSLKTRKFIGNTSMDPQLSLLMANQARVKSGDLVLDPFVGTGSLLVAAAEFGGYVFGTDIDYLMLHGRTKPSRITQQKREKDESVKANMQQYNLEHHYVDVLVNDFSMVFWKTDFKFDSIIADPPYGIREATERIGTVKENYTINEKHLPTHIPAKVEYGLARLYKDLLNFSANFLKVGGRLVFWFPIFREDYSEEKLPSHTCLTLVGNSEQVLSKFTSRRLLTYEKFKNPDNEEFTCDNNIVDFRFKYYKQREETRKERRTKKAEEREQARLKFLKQKEHGRWISR